ncbi:MAG: NAD-dependent epimerase/dehydratase family protein [Bacteroidales bacterium]|nr:NAD-dependent epimerase/dehydratase family protein [Bacteroidales bacterium]
MRVLILGGTGAIGSFLVEYFTDTDNEVYVTSRKDRKDYKNIHYLKGNAHDQAFISPILEKKWDAIVDFMVYDSEEFAKALPALCEATNQYVFLSSARVFADSAIIDEKSPKLIDVIDDRDYLSSNDYAIRKCREERIIVDSGYNNCTIIRPYITFSEKRLQLGILEKEKWLYRALDRRAIVIYGDFLDRMTTLTFGKDVAFCIGKLIGNRLAIGEDYNIMNPEPITWREILSVYLDAIEAKFGYRPNVVQQDITRSGKGYYGWRYDRNYNRVFDINKLRNTIGQYDFVDAKSALRNSIDSFLDNPSFLAINYADEAEFDRITGESTPLSRIIGIRNKAKYLLCRYFLMRRIINLFR